MKDFSKYSQKQLKWLARCSAIKGWFSKHYAVVLFVLVALCGIVGLVVFLVDGNSDTATLDSSDLLTFFLGLMTLAGTIFLGYAAHKQGEIANEMNKRMVQNDIRRYRLETTPSLLVLEMRIINENEAKPLIRNAKNKNWKFSYINPSKNLDTFEEEECDEYYCYMSLQNTQNEIIVLEHMSLSIHMWEYHTELEMDFENYNLDMLVVNEKERLNVVARLEIPKTEEVEIPPWPKTSISLSQSGHLDSLNLKLHMLSRLGQEYEEEKYCKLDTLHDGLDEIRYSFPVKDMPHNTKFSPFIDNS